MCSFFRVEDDHSCYGVIRSYEGKLADFFLFIHGLDFQPYFAAALGTDLGFQIVH